MTDEEIEKTKLGVYEKLKESGWSDPLKSFILSQDMTILIAKLDQESMENRHWTPRFKQVFRAFYECPYDKMKVICLGQDVYPHLNKDGKTVCDGLAFSVSNTMWPQPSLSYIHGNIAETVYPGKEYLGPLDLKVWANQGVLLINTALTTQIGKTGQHYTLWSDFINYLMDHINWKRSEVPWALFGKTAQQKAKSLGSHIVKMECVHPASAAYAKSDKWTSGDPSIWIRINDQLKRIGKDPVIW